MVLLPTAAMRTAYCSAAYCVRRPGTAVAALALVLRRMLALAGFVAVVTLALLLLYRVYVHHIHAEPYVEEERSVVGIDVKIASAFA